jgi:pimeloyl-ACP methyl ester carboxylesterase
MFSVAKDHEAVRIALDNEPLNMVGLSYGSQIGAQYAQLFPKNIRTLVLDGVLQHSQSESANIFTESLAYSLSLSHFFAWAASDESSPLKGQDVEALWLSLTHATDVTISAPSCNGTDCSIDVTTEEILFNAQGYLTFKNSGFGSSWETLSSALYNATQGDASALSTRFDDHVAVSEGAIGCLDWTHTSSLTLAGVQAKEHMAETFAPITQGATQTWRLQHSCLGWPVDVKNPPKKLDVDTEATILMVNSDADPSTPYSWATAMLEEIRNKVLVTRKGDGHTSLILGGEAAECIAEYLITGVAPRDGLLTIS